MQPVGMDNAGAHDVRYQGPGRILSHYNSSKLNNSHGGRQPEGTEADKQFCSSPSIPYNRRVRRRTRVRAVVVDKEPALDLVDGKVAVVVPVALAEFVEVALPDVLADQVHHCVVSLPKPGRPVAGNEVGLSLHQDADRIVVEIGRVGVVVVGGGGGLSRGGIDDIGSIH